MSYNHVASCEAIIAVLFFPNSRPSNGVNAKEYSCRFQPTFLNICVI